jgi:mRNA-degrading endonuclease RelE of RelBE toxin-antitoxin system
MGLIRNLFPRLYDDTERQVTSLMRDINKAFDDFDFDATVDSIVKGSKSAFASLNDIAKSVKDTVSDLKVIIQYDEKKEKFEYKVEDGILKVRVTGKNSVRETSATVPSNCLVDKITHYVDKKNGNLVVRIPKDVKNDENIKKFKESVINTANGTAEWIKNALKERAESVAASTTAPTSKPKTTKKPVRKPHSKVVRGKDGKFRSTNSN